MNHPTLVAFFNILFNYLIQVYLERFETLKCSCAFDPRRDISKSLLLIFYVLIIGKLICPDIPSSAKFFILIFTFIFDIVFISYIFSLKQKKCYCDNVAQDTTTAIFYYYYLLLFFLVLLTITIFLILLPVNLFMMKNK